MEGKQGRYGRDWKQTIADETILHSMTRKCRKVFTEEATDDEKVSTCEMSIEKSSTFEKN